MAEPNEVGRKQAAPPYVSYPSLKNMVAGYKAAGRPGRIDRSVLSNFSGAVAGQLLTALKFLDLTDAEGHPNDRLDILIAAHGTKEWPEALAEIIRSSYRPVFTLDLERATPNQFNTRFRDAYPMEGETFRKCLTFFLHAVQDAKIPVSGYILKNKKPRTNGTPRKPRAPKATASAKREPEQENPPLPPAGQTANQRKPLQYELIDLMQEPDITDEHRAAIWNLVQYLAARPSKKGG